MLVRELERDDVGIAYLARTGAGYEARLREIPPEFALSLDSGRMSALAGKVLQLKHRHLAQVHSIEAHGDRWWIATDALPERTLANVLAQGAVTRPRAMELLVALASVVDYLRAHQIVLGPVQPADVRIGAAEVLLDLSAAWFLTAERRGLGYDFEEVMPSNPRYYAPECLRGDAVTAASDVYSLGLIAFQLFTGRWPFGGASPMDEWKRKLKGDIESVGSHELPEAATVVLRRCLATEPGARWPSAGAFVAALEYALSTATRMAGERTGVTAPAADAPTCVVGASLLELHGPGATGLAPPRHGRVIHFLAIASHPVVGRAVEFTDAAGTSREFTCAWTDVVPLAALIREACLKPLLVTSEVHSAEAWSKHVLELTWNARTAYVRLDFKYAGPDAELIDQILRALGTLAANS